MKKLVLALAAIAAFGGSALAADMSTPRTYTKAPAFEALASWTGFYISGGGGYGLWAADTTAQDTATGVCSLCVKQRQGGEGWFGTVGAGYDWQVNQTWVVGVLANGQFGSINGSIQDQGPAAVGTEKMRTAYAAGVRVGYLVAPNVLSYLNAGYSGSSWSGTTFVSTFNGNDGVGNTGGNIPAGGPVGFSTNGFNRNGFFLGGGVENNLNIFGIAAPGWFMKTEYRGAYYGKKNISEISDGSNIGTYGPAGTLVGTDITFKPVVQTISTSLVYRFN